MPLLIRREIAADDVSVRDTACEMMGLLEAEGLAPRHLQSIEIAMVEAMNNIVEHALAGSGQPMLTLSVQLDHGQLTILLCDNGQPLPDLKMPRGHVVQDGTAQTDLPEGGFGWFLIRALTRRLEYERIGGCNLLTLCFDLETDG